MKHFFHHPALRKMTDFDSTKKPQYFFQKFLFKYNLVVVVVLIAVVVVVVAAVVAVEVMVTEQL